ncbi:hypothetical protein [Georgenia sp. AZ-5]|uniref:hypothetical protein n=1 Tax=Georgenia sp. AZ-5 TaxID=3367526 RepID=UPI003754DFA5
MRTIASGIAALALAAGVASGASAQTQTVAVAHTTPSGNVIVLLIPAQAAEAHIAHGDAVLA